MKSEEEDRMKAFSDEDPVSIPIDGILDLHTLLQVKFMIW